MDARGPVEASRLTPAASKAVDRGRVGLAKAVAGVHGSICVWSRTRLSDTTGLSCPRLPGMVLCPLLWEFPPLTTVPTRSYHCATCVSSWSIPRCPWANTLCCCCLEPHEYAGYLLPPRGNPGGVAHDVRWVAGHLRCLSNLAVEFFQCTLPKKGQIKVHS